MSRKVDTFRQFISNPQNTHNFFVDIPGIGEYGMVVQSTSFPSETARQTVLFVAGERVIYPTVPDNSHSWTVVVPEGDGGQTRAKFEALRKKYWDQKSGAITVNQGVPFDRVNVYARDLNGNVSFSVTLVNCWLAGRGDVQLDQSNPENNWKWNYAFVFDYILDSE